MGIRRIENSNPRRSIPHRTNLDNVPYPLSPRQEEIVEQKPAEHPPHVTHNSEATNFSSLPPEIRQMIWKYVIANVGPRIVNVTVAGPYGHSEEPELKMEHTYPAVLEVCRESRMIALRYYEWFLREELRYRINSETDVIRFPKVDILAVYLSWLNRRAKSRSRPRPRSHRQLENDAEYLVIEGLQEYPTLETLEHCGFGNLSHIMLQKPEKGLDFAQSQYLRSLDWHHSPIKHNESRFVNYINNRDMELSFLTQSDLESDEVSSPFSITERNYY